MSRPAELTRSEGQLEDAALEARGYQRCEHCGKASPLTVSRCRRRTCPAKWNEDGSCEVTETVLAAGRSYLNYVSRKLTARSGCTMRNLRIARIVWAWLSGLIADPRLDPWDELVAVCLLDCRPVPVRGP
jgi:hypothetical protein